MNLRPRSWTFGPGIVVYLNGWINLAANGYFLPNKVQIG